MVKFPKSLLSLFIYVLIFFGGSGVIAQIDAGISFDLQGYIFKEIAKGKTTITVPPGRYRVKPNDGVHLAFKNLNGITIDATGVEMICTETTRAITINNCQNLNIKGLTIDYDPLPFTQGRIVSMSEDKMTHIIQLFDGYPTHGKISCKKYEIFKPDTHTLRYGSYFNGEIEKLSSGELKYTKAQTFASRAAPEMVGDLIVTDFKSNYKGIIGHAVFIKKSKKTILDSVTLFGSNVFGFFEEECDESQYRHCVVDRRPPLTDLKERAYKRLRSTNADAFHSKHAVVGPAYLNCTARFQGDDCFAINGDFHMVVQSKGKRIRVLAKRELDIEAGDSVQIVDDNGNRLPDAYVESVKRVGLATKEEQERVANLPMHKGLKNSFSGAYEIELDHTVSLGFASAVCSANRIGNGFRVIGCHLGFNRSRGILVKAGNGIIQDNQIDNCWMESIKLTPEFWWMEAGCSRSVTIKDNVILNSGGHAISVVSKTREDRISPAGIHQNILITNNTIGNSRSPQILVTSTNGLVIKNNKIEASPDESLDAIQVTESKNTEISDNQIQ